MTNIIEIICENLGGKVEVPMGTPLSEVAKRVALGPYPFLAALVNNRIKELYYKIYTPVSVRFVDITSFSGIRVYQRTSWFILQKAVRDLFPGKTLHIRHSMGQNGFYCEVEGIDEFSHEQAAALEGRMRYLVAQDLPISRMKILTSEVRARYAAQGLTDKIALLDTRPRLYSDLYTLGDTDGYFYGALAPSTGFIDRFGIEPYYNGFYLALPLRTAPDRLNTNVEQEKMFGIFQEYQSWVRIMGVPTVGAVNSKVLAGDAGGMIKLAEAFHERKFAWVADTIYDANISRGVRMVLISGPSSSGKTTSAKRLGIQLGVLGLHPVLISLDDYFVDREKTPRDADGNYDYEALEAIDLGLFNDHLCRLVADAAKRRRHPALRLHHGAPHVAQEPADARRTLDPDRRRHPRAQPAPHPERPRSAEIPHLHLVLHVGGDGQPLAHRHDRQPPAAPPHARLYATRRRCRGDAFALGLRPPRRGEAHLPLPGKRRRHAQLVALLRNLGVAPLCRKDPPRGSRHGTRVRRGAAHAEVPEKLHPHPARRDPAHVYHPGVESGAAVSSTDSGKPRRTDALACRPTVSAATPRFAACGCLRGRLRPTEAYPCATGKI